MRGTIQVLLISLRDYAHEMRLSLCAVAALTAVLTPLLVLFGLKHGIVSTMLEDLRSSPHVRAIQPLGQGHYDLAWLEALRKHPGVEFVMPTTRYLSATVEVASTDAPRGRMERAEMMPTGPGDPLWRGTDLMLTPDSVQVVISASLSERTGVGAGGTLQGRIGRTVAGGERQGVSMALAVADVLPIHLVQRDVVLVPLAFLESVEDYREGRAAPFFGWPGEPSPERSRVYASFRLYAETLDDVLAVRDHLVTLGVDTDTAAAQIQMVKGIDRALTALFLIISSLAAGGYALSMMLNLVALVARKQQDLSTLKMLGFSNAAVSLFPVFQAVVTAVAGFAFGAGLYFLAAPLINTLFAEGLREGQVVCALLPEHLAVAFGASLAIAIVTSVVGGYRAAAIQPAEGLRHD